MSASFTVKTTRHRRVQRATGYIWSLRKPEPGDYVQLWSPEERDFDRDGILVRWNRDGHAIVQRVP